MSDPRPPRDGDRLEAAIDDALAQAVRRTAPAGMRARVIARRSEPSRAKVIATSVTLAAAAAVVVMLAIAIHRPLSPAAPPSAIVRVPPSPTGIPTLETSPASPAPVPAAGGPMAAVRAAPTRPDAAHPPSVEDDERLLEVDRVNVARLELPALEIEPLADQAPAAIAPLRTDSVVVAPLSAGLGDSSPLEEKP